LTDLLSKSLIRKYRFRRGAVSYSNGPFIDLILVELDEAIIEGTNGVEAREGTLEDMDIC
jgi:hypothetical protein